MRRPFQGVLNIVRFNWHFYVLATVVISTLLIAKTYFSPLLGSTVAIVAVLAAAGIIVSLSVSYYVYDHSGFYKLRWLDELNITGQQRLVNINAGFDETSTLLQHRYKDAVLYVYDFYDPQKHTEVSIKRARKAYPVYKGTKTISTSNAGFEKESADYIFAILAVHEIRGSSERIDFFKELKDSLRAKGKIIVVEHLRNLPNFIAYNIGFFHFFPRKEWINTFVRAGLSIDREFRITPFIRCFILTKNGITS